MKYQVALDAITMDDALTLVQKIYDDIDVIELGSPFVWTHPIQAISDFKRRFSKAKILADYKIMDGGAYCAQLAFDAGADIITVAGVSLDANIQGAIDAAHACGKEALVDMMAVPFELLGDRAGEIEKMGADYICIHRGLGVTTSPVEHLKLLRNILNKTKIAIAGGINLDTMKEIAPYQPDLVIIGSALAKATDPLRYLREMKQIGEAYV